MKRLLLLAAILLVAHSGIFAQFGTVWQRTTANGNMPTWFGADLERGVAYGNVGGKERVYVVSRLSTTTGNMRILDALTGEDVKKTDGVTDSTLNITGISGGTYFLNDVEVSADGKIFTTNLTTNASTSAFKVYMWANENAAPVNVVNFTDAALVNGRFGDRITVTGSVSDNSFVLYAASSLGNVLKVTTADNGVTFNTEVITIGGTYTPPFTQPVATPIPGSTDFYFNASNRAVIRYTSAGAPIDT
ncbi:MAG TPA: DUF4623 domain-containing protein, partial [Ignavibacteriales bacterium]|nr:DUF4623 domain-containing protein [Ignavibacteriales bacterium]